MSQSVRPPPQTWTAHPRSTQEPQPPHRLAVNTTFVTSRTTVRSSCSPLRCPAYPPTNVRIASEARDVSNSGSPLLACLVLRSQDITVGPEQRPHWLHNAGGASPKALKQPALLCGLQRGARRQNTNLHLIKLQLGTWWGHRHTGGKKARIVRFRWCALPTTTQLSTQRSSNPCHPSFCRDLQGTAGSSTAGAAGWPEQM